MSLNGFGILILVLCGFFICVPVMADSALAIGGTTSPDSPAEKLISVDQEKPGYLLYNETFAGYSILYPDKAGVLVTGEKNTTRETFFRTPSNISIMRITVVPTNMTLEELANATSEGVQNLQDFELLGINETTIDNSKGIEMDYTWTDKTGSTSHTCVKMTVKDNRAYIFTTQFPETAFAMMQPVIDEMIASFRFIPVTVEKGWYYDPWYGWFWWPDTADMGIWNWDNYMYGISDDYFASSDYWGTGMDWIDVSNKRWDWYWNE